MSYYLSIGMFISYFWLDFGFDLLCCYSDVEFWGLGVLILREFYLYFGIVLSCYFRK